MFLAALLRLFPSLAVQGQCVITVQLNDEELAVDEEGVDYFLLFAGSTQRHLTSTLRSDRDTLHALCPGKPAHPQSLTASLLPPMDLWECSSTYSTSHC